jgi:hypothetical protein
MVPDNNVEMAITIQVPNCNGCGRVSTGNVLDWWQKLEIGGSFAFVKSYLAGTTSHVLGVLRVIQHGCACTINWRVSQILSPPRGLHKSRENGQNCEITQALGNGSDKMNTTAGSVDPVNHVRSLLWQE